MPTLHICMATAFTSIFLLNSVLSDSGFPQINGVHHWNESINLKAGDILELRCVNQNSSTNWTLPSHRSIFAGFISYANRLSVTNRTTIDKENGIEFDSRLTLANTVAADTGWYTCTDATTGTQSLILVYVNGPYEPIESPSIIAPDASTAYKGMSLNMTCSNHFVVVPVGWCEWTRPEAHNLYTTENASRISSESTNVVAIMKSDLQLDNDEFWINLFQEHEQNQLTENETLNEETTWFMLGGLRWKREATLNIKNLQLHDSSLYTCTCTDRKNQTNSSAIFITVCVQGQNTAVSLVLATNGHVALSLVSNQTEFIMPVGETMKFQANYTAWPIPVYITWIHSYFDVQTDRLVTREKERDTCDNRNTNVVTAIALFSLNNLAVGNSGNYTVSVSAGTDTKNITFQLHVTERSTTQKIYTDIPRNSFQFLQLNEEYNVTCISSGNYPLTDVRLRWKQISDTKVVACRSSENCSILPLRGDEAFIRQKRLIEGTFEKGVRLTILAQNTSTLYCDDHADTNADVLEYVVTDVPDSIVNDGIAIKVSGASGPEGTVLVGDNITLSCKAQKYAYKELLWTANFLNNFELQYVAFSDDHNCATSWAVHNLENNLGYMQQRPTALCNTTQYSRNLEIHMPNAQFSYNAVYTCQTLKTMKNRDSIVHRSYTLVVKRPYIPRLENSSTDFTISYSKPVNLSCWADAMPAATILWYKSNKPIMLDTHEKTLSDRNQTLKINFALKDDAGDYRCEATNRLGTATRKFHVTVYGGPVEFSRTNQIVLGVFLAIFGVFLIGMLIAVAILTKRTRQRQFRILLLQKHLWENAISTDETKSYFGCYKSLINPQLPLYDQIDSLKYDTRFEIPKELLDLRHQATLGVGHFGTVVKCIHFDDQSKQTGRFVAVKMPKIGTNEYQLNALLNEVKVMIYVDRHPNVLRLLGAVTKYMVSGELYMVMELCSEGSLLEHLTKLRKDFQNELVHRTIQQPAKINEDLKSDEYLQPLQVSLGQLAETCYKNETNPGWSQNFDKKRSIDSVLATSDLLSYAYQIAQGMEHLASRNLIHRNLAARNVLLTNNRLVKISDFGLARQEQIYQIRNDCELPIHWMALESLLRFEYSVKSDVWSYGVVLWELFTLGERPYTGMPCTELKDFLNRGRRMDQPTFCPPAIYSLMRQCWLSEPDDRPSFTDCKLATKRELELCSPEMSDQIEIATASEDNCTLDFTNDARESSCTSTLNKNGYSLVPDHAASEEVAVPNCGIDSGCLTPEESSNIDETPNEKGALISMEIKPTKMYTKTGIPQLDLKLNQELEMSL